MIVYHLLQRGAGMDSFRAYNYLESAILTGRLKPRERLVEQELAEQLKMSRTPIREALRRLGERGLVRILPRRGAVVSDISPAEVENIYVVRSALEGLAARLAADHITPEEIQRVQELETAHAQQATEGDVRALMVVNDQFHDAIYGAVRNACLLDMIQQLRRQIHTVRFNAWAQPERIARSLAEHRQMMEALNRRDGDGLARLTEEHLRVAKESYLFHLGAQPAPAADRDPLEAFAGSVTGNRKDRRRG
jgi:DNA-binding GntR family transcriptional regulator